MNLEEERFKSRRMKNLINKGFYLQDAQKIVDTEVVQRRKLKKRLEGRVPPRYNPDFDLVEHYKEE